MIQGAWNQTAIVSHGLTQNEPLVFEKIIRGCFNNPHRKNYPDFARQRGCGEYSLCTEHDDPEYWINLVSHIKKEQFNQKEITTHDLSKIHDLSMPTRIPVDKALFLETMQNSRWCGPYRHKSYDEFYFFSVVGSGDNEYYVCLRIDLATPSVQCLGFYFRLSMSSIAPFVII